MEGKAEAVDLVITGEGKTDIQTSYGKLPAGVAAVAKKYGKKVVVISGSVEPCEELYAAGIDALFSIANRPMTLEYAIENAESLLRQASYNVIKLISV